MRVFKLSFLVLVSALFIASCNKSDVADRVYNPQNQPYEIGRIEGGFLEDDELIGPESLDLQALGPLLERANNGEDFEYLLNSEEGINNLDLNDDGYADYISVREFGDGYDDERGFSLFSMFGDNLIQEIAQIVFDRNGYDNGYYPGSRVLIRGNDYLYGDNYYYETDWRDRQLPFIDWTFADRDNVYSSPYYYQNYPGYYEPYTVVETPVYLTRVEQYYYSPVFVQTSQPTITQIEVVSPYQEVSLSQAYMKQPKEQRAQRRERIMVERTQQRAQFEREKPAKLKDLQAREDRQFPGNPNRAEKQEKFRQEKFQNEKQQMREMREKPGKPERVERQQEQKFERPQKQQQQKFERQQQKAERQQQRFERPQQQKQQRVERPQQQQRVERQQQRQVQKQQQVNQPQRQEVRGNPNKGGGGNPNKGGGGNPNKGGGNGGGGGKGKGKG